MRMLQGVPNCLLVQITVVPVLEKRSQSAVDSETSASNVPTPASSKNASPQGLSFLKLSSNIVLIKKLCGL